jgi:arylsulfatase A-like enzyme
MIRSRLLLLGCLLLLPVSAAPNVVFFLVDDLGAMDVGFNNPAAFAETPRLDDLAKRSMRFRHAYSASPVCSPTRSAILTGQAPARTRHTDYFGAPNGFQAIPQNYQPAEHGRFGPLKDRPVLPAPYLERLDATHRTLAGILREAGYATMHAGKWHLGPEDCWPEHRGFDVNKGGHSLGGPYGGDKYFSPFGNPRLPDGPAGEHLPDRLAREVASFIGDHKERPFFVHFSFYSVHTPLIGRPDLVEKYRRKKQALGLKAAFEDEVPRKNRTIQEHAVYAAMVEAMDQAVGTVLDALEEHGVADNTIVVFFSDNGGLSTSEGSPTSNLPLRAGKGWMYEGGIRVPMLVCWPGTVRPGSVCDTPVIATDFSPTLTAACGLPAQPEQHLDGVNLLPLLRGKSFERGPLFWHYPHWGNQGGIPSSAVRDGPWKLIRFHWKKSPELYHLGDDPGERRNLAEARPEEFARLSALLDAHLQETKALMPAPNPAAKEPFAKW